MKFLIYAEVLILAQLFLLYRGLKKHMSFLSNTADFYSENNIHFWQPRKALEIYENMTAKKKNELIRDVETLKREAEKFLNEEKKKK